MKKLCFILLSLILVGNISCITRTKALNSATPTDQIARFLDRNPNLEPELIEFVLTSIEREIQAEEMSHIFRLNTNEYREFPLSTERLEEIRANMIEMWTEFGELMPPEAHLFFVVIRDRDERILAEGYLGLSNEKTVLNELWMRQDEITIK